MNNFASYQLPTKIECSGATLVLCTGSVWKTTCGKLSARERKAIESGGPDNDAELKFAV